MKTLIVLAVGLLAVGCGKTEQPLEPSQLSAEPSPTNSPPNLTDQNTTKAEPVKELTLEEKVVGEYEIGINAQFIWAFLENGIVEEYIDSKKQTGETKWSIVNGEIHVIDDSGLIDVFRINKVGFTRWISGRSINRIASIIKGKRIDVPEEDQFTYRKIK